jgi:phytoene dehydrogenase-like protein
MRDLDVAVVGGGLAGLTSAAFAGRAGASVRVFERAGSPGGRAQTRERDGFLFNLGPHALYRGGEATAALRELGVRMSGGVPPTGGAYAIRAGRKHTLPVGAYSLMTTGLLHLSGKVEAGRFLAGLGSMRTSFYDHVPVADWLRAELHDEGARDLLAALLRVATYAHDPERQSAGASLAQAQRASLAGVLYLDGGWQTLVDGLREAAVSTGVEVKSRCGVSEIAPRAGAGFDLRLADGTRVGALTVVVATPPREAATLLASLTKDAAEWASSSIPVRAACLDLALRGLPRPAVTFGLGIDQPLYASVHTRAARLSPPGGVVFQLARYLGAAPAVDERAVERELEDLAELLQPGWREKLVHGRFLPDLVVSHALVRADRGGLAGRPGPPVPGVPGAFLAGDWVGPRGMLADAALASAREAARLATEHALSVRRAA